MRKKRTWSRRKTALCRVLLLCAVAAAMVLSGLYKVSPTQTLDYLEQIYALKEMEPFHTERGKYDPVKDRLVMLSRNEDYILISLAKFHPLTGWESQGVAGLLEPDDPEQRNFVWEVSKQGTDENWICLVGFVPDGGEAPTIRFGVYDMKAKLADETDYIIDPVTIVPTPTIPVEGGMLYMEQYSYSTQGCQEKYDLEYCEIVTRMYENGEWVPLHYWVSTGMG